MVLNYLRTLNPLDSLDLKGLTMKFVMLMALLTGQRRQTLQLMDIRNIRIENDCMAIRIGDPVKQTRPGTHLDEIRLNRFVEVPALCIVELYLEYLKRTKALCKDQTQLFISYMKPYDPVSRDTLSRWIKCILTSAGIDMSIFTPHSTRAASTSCAKKQAVPLDTILKTAGWTHEKTFAKHYNKHITQEGEYAQRILQHT